MGGERTYADGAQGAVADRVDRCVVCGHPTERTRHGVSQFEECPACGLARVQGYDGRDDYWHGLNTDSEYWSTMRRRYFQAALSALPRGRLLDVGGGVGEFVQVALEVGRDAYSFDSSPEATDAARERIGARALSNVDGTFDIVTLWCVIAHVLDPGQLLETARAAVRPGGVLWLTTPNFDFQKRYAVVLAKAGRPMVFGGGDDHLWHFTPDSLSRALAEHGFGDVRFVYRGVTEWCCGAGRSASWLIAGKRGWNRAAIRLHRAGGPLLTSELQALATRAA